MDDELNPIYQWYLAGLFEPAEVHQAVGMLMVRNRITSTEALASIRDHALDTRQRAIDVADQIISGYLSLPGWTPATAHALETDTLL